MAKAQMPNGGDEKIDGGAIYVIRDSIPIEKEETPKAQSCIWGGGFRVYPVETVPALLERFKDVKFARLTAPAGSPLYVNAELVVDRDDRSVIQDLEQTKSVLCFGTGADAARIRIRETTEDLVKIWDKLGVATDPLL